MKDNNLVIYVTNLVIKDSDLNMKGLYINGTVMRKMHKEHKEREKRKKSGKEKGKKDKRAKVRKQQNRHIQETCFAALRTLTPQTVS
jgi:hypothetical protein